MKIGVLKETAAREKRVAAVPDTVKQYVKMGYEVLIEHNAGRDARLPDSVYEEAGARIVPSSSEIWTESDIVLKVRPPSTEEAQNAREGQIIICLFWPAQNPELIETLAAQKATVLALDAIPRISRAQAVDVLSSQAAISGYRAVIEAAQVYGRCFGAQFTAAGKSDPANVLVIGAGVAGLAAIAAARDLGAQVSAFDTREAVKEEIETLGAKALNVEFEESGEGTGGYAKVMSPEFIAAEMKLFKDLAPKTDIVITTAAIPGRRAPTLVKQEMLEAMREGSVVVDLAAETGGNCELTKADEIVEFNGVQIIGYTDLTSRMPTHASDFFSRNIAQLIGLLGKADAFKIDLEDDIFRQMIVLQDGEKMWPPPPLETPAHTPPAERAPIPVDPAPLLDSAPKKSPAGFIASLILITLAVVIGLKAPSNFIQHLAIFVLACFVGWKVIWNVKASLHTPLMSVTNAISGIIILGGLLQMKTDSSQVVLALGGLATLVASINVFGGFLVTQRMLAMFRSDKATKGGQHV
ncbi:Re/Si-specific NAD(P)(+) transhydrogenase subunit alpha [Microvenator marinus]|uniref:NAD(P) transhydrogenase subunit alpha n=1 Tax=Microvenator marinus TaxID=2600177 RepID=A0A5B8XXM9_9DELT|nr:Re/Si-specific NAD(P)(+) transhydrogenase subunit alpha [Microvenator marinus]QED28219.1 Re/Si-specific NAD(P)(+) transhydrogenase subunit alpha [Microvenator marinus]